MPLRSAAVLATLLGAGASAVGLVLLVTVGPGVPLIVLAQPVIVLAGALWLAYLIERGRDRRRT